MSKATTVIWLPREDAERAIELYTNLIDGSRCVRKQTFEGDSPEASADIYDVVIAGTPYQIMAATPQAELNERMSIWLVVEDQATLDRYWDGILAAGGKELQCGWITDPFGLSWQIVPQAFLDLTDTDDQEQINRVHRQVLKQVRLDVEELEAAAKG